MVKEALSFDYSRYDFKDPVNYEVLLEPGLSERTVRAISEYKREPEWMTRIRLRALDIFRRKPLPTWGGDLSHLDFDSIRYYARPSDVKANSWDQVPEYIKRTFDRLGIPEAERRFLAGVGAQYESEVVYHRIREDLEKRGVVFVDTDTAVQKYPDIVKRYFGTVIPPEDNKFAALNTAVWSGGSFIYVPRGVHVDLPLQAYFRINAANIGQFERTLIIAEPYSKVHYIEGCTAPIYSSQSLHSAVVEIIAMEGAHVRYTTLQNWSKDVYNLVTKRAVAHRGAFVEWVDANVGSRLTMKYPSVYMIGPGARAEILSVAFAGRGQHQDTGAKAVHLAPNTTSRITAKSVSKDSGRTTYRGLVHVAKGARNVKSSVRCDALLLDDESRTDTYPYMEINESDATITHEATVGKIGDEQLFYLMSRGLTETEALNMVVMGFFEPFAKSIPLEYAVEFNRLIELEMSGAVG
jgi:Fe-S cluster assembly protein SufB